MAGELLIQVIDIARFRAVRPTLDALDAARTLGLESCAVLRDAAASPFARRDRHRRLTGLLGRVLRHPELELRVFLAPHELDEVIEGVVHVLCFENGADSSLTSLVGPNWVVLESAYATFIDLDWFRAIFLDVDVETRLAYPRHGERGYWVLSRDDVTRLAAGVRALLEERAAAPQVRSAAEGLGRLAAEVLSCENLTLAHTSLL